MDTREIQTKTQGPVTITEEQTLSFVTGLLGFEDEKEFALIPSNYEPFFWLQSLKTAALAFLVVDPFLVRKDYEVDIDDKSLEAIGVSSPADVGVLGIVTAPSRPGQGVTVNLQGPIIINKRNRKCFQAVLTDTTWTTKHEIAAELQKRSAPC
ncbi:MAG: flagellar assembly protein FliW [Spirochaetaceae bacterium]|jgi:flagellar assembly factor FliW|nr:flagellar assembly protein FliW [Spirochaetaceae bacterium]